MNPSLSIVQRLGVAITIGLLAVYMWISLTGIQETQEAKIVESVQISLQETVSKGMAELQLPPHEIHPLNIVHAAKSSFPKGVKLDSSFRLSIPNSKRTAQFKVTPSGDLIVVSLTNFTRFRIENGRVVRNNHWLLPLDFEMLDTLRTHKASS